MAAHHDGVFTSRNSKFGGAFALGLGSIVQEPRHAVQAVGSSPGALFAQKHARFGKAEDYIGLIEAVQPHESILAG
jgi:hypothetical protein